MAAPQIQEEDPENEWSITEDWLESMEFTRPGQGNWSQHDQADTIVIELPANKIRSCLKKVFGWSICDPDSQTLKRTLPMQHPIFPWLWASTGTSSFFGPVGNNTYKSDDDKPTPREESVGVYNGPEYYARYAKVKLAINFRPFTGLILADDDETWSGLESQRFIGMKQMSPNLELMTTQSAAGISPFIFADNDGTYPATGPNGDKFEGYIFTRKTTVNYQIEWLNVEESYLCNTDDPNYFIFPYPERLIKYLGYVNKETYAGHAPGTLLFNGVQAVRYPQPVRTVGDYNLWAWDLVLSFQKFDPQDPPRPGSVVPAAGTPPASDLTPKRGHLLMPCKSNLGWFYATRSSDSSKAGTYNGDPILPSIEFEEIFKYWDA
jgi:hypothetical protein